MSRSNGCFAGPGHCMLFPFMFHQSADWQSTKGESVQQTGLAKHPFSNHIQLKIGKRCHLAMTMALLPHVTIVLGLVLPVSLMALLVSPEGLQCQFWSPMSQVSWEPPMGQVSWSGSDCVLALAYCFSSTRRVAYRCGSCQLPSLATIWGNLGVSRRGLECHGGLQ